MNTLRVRVKEGQSGFYGIKLWREGEEFELEDRYHSVQKDENGDPLLVPVSQQFSHKWMEALEPFPEEKPAQKETEPVEAGTEEIFSTVPQKRKYTRRKKPE